MTMTYYLGVLVLVLCADAAYEGEACSKNGVPGVCTNIRSCQSAIDDLRKRKNPQICGFSGTDPIVCCDSGAPVPTTTRRPVATTTRRSSTTTEYIPPVYDYVSVDHVTNGQCEALSPSLTSPRTGQKAWDKCIEYQENLVYPCEKGAALTGELTRQDHCGHSADELIIGGVDAARQEFPHMVLLGYGDLQSELQWLCGGSLVSDRFVLTAGHCTSSRESGAVTYVLAGALKRTEQVDSSKLYRVKRIVKHPQYKPPLKYNDIALLETETLIKLDQFVVPACLHVGDQVKDERALATGWGLTEYRGDSANNLQKVTLTKFTTEECGAQFPVARNMPRGYDPATQMCYGDRTRSKDTCQGDSGGPLQIKSRSIHCMYTIIGVTSFGKACGFVGEPGIYTRVAPFVPWLESVVWA